MHVYECLLVFVRLKKENLPLIRIDLSDLLILVSYTYTLTRLTQ